MNSNFLTRCLGSKVARLSALAALSLVAGFSSFHAAPAAAADQLSALTTTFVARDATRYKENPDLSSYGLPNITVVYEDSLWPAGASHAEPDINFITNNYIPKIKNTNPDVLVIDIEAWPFKSTTSATEITANINKFKKVIAAFRKGLPNTKLGIYLILPERNWLAPCGDPGKVKSRTSSWHQRNLKLQPLADAVDIIFPSLYTFYPDSKSIACWPTYAKANIKEARIYGKPVWAFLWMKYHSTGGWIPASFWRRQLDTVYGLADGLVIWSMAGTDKWSSTAPWWVQTKDFMADRNLD